MDCLCPIPCHHVLKVMVWKQNQNNLGTWLTVTAYLEKYTSIYKRFFFVRLWGDSIQGFLFSLSCESTYTCSIWHLQTLDTFGNCQRPVSSLCVSQHKCMKKQTCKNLGSISHICCKKKKCPCCIEFFASIFPDAHQERLHAGFMPFSNSKYITAKKFVSNSVL